MKNQKGLFTGCEKELGKQAWEILIRKKFNNSEYEIKLKSHEKKDVIKELEYLGVFD